ncbi:MAG: sigma-54 dependent transcriptional regulator [Nitrospinota bacterium]|nr:sigma-54 dependent transcriptional regulator [Nitrospinota bacterium]
MPNAGRILIVEDESSIRFVLSKFLTGRGFSVDAVERVEDAKTALKATHYQLHFLDIRLPDGNGLDLLGWIKQQGAKGTSVVMTAESTMKNAIRAVRKGAFEYLVKPFDLKEIEEILNRLEQRRLLISSSKLDPYTRPVDETDYEIIGNSPAMQKLYKKIGKAASSKFTVLVTGESGSGKELVARNVHEFSDRTGKPFVTLNCAAVPKDLIESELFGHVKGAFTGADRERPGRLREAHGGTLFMDEIGDTPLNMQAKLLRFLEEGKITPVGGNDFDKVDVRFIAATNKPLKKMVEKNEFREDLYHRLNVISIKVPPLRERIEDIEILARYFTKKFGEGKKISDTALYELSQRAWPGNVRQLQNTITRAIVMTDDDILLPSSFSPPEEESPAELDVWLAREIEKGGESIYKRVVEEVEGKLIRKALEKTKGNKIAAAKLLGINRNTLSSKLK